MSWKLEGINTPLRVIIYHNVPEYCPNQNGLYVVSWANLKKSIANTRIVRV